MSTQTKELIEICEQLPEDQRAEVADFARFLLEKNGTGSQRELAERWLASSHGAAMAGVTTAQVMSMTRGES